MKEAKKLQRIRSWFEQHGIGVLELPDGPFGPSEETFLSLTYLEFLPHKLLMEFDTQILLVFTDIKRVEQQKSALLLTDFRQCLVDWQDFGSMEPHVKIFHNGTVTIRPPSGKLLK